MRPISLELYGFGPFATKTNIEFDRFGNKGIFLITGTTGSGKTSIFDAILFALYGVASGDNRDTSMFKTLGLPDGEEPYVKFKFEAKNKLYEIRRTLSYKRKAKKGDGFTSEDASAAIYCDGKIIVEDKFSVRKDPAAIEVEKILGVNYKQYKMLSILPQGEFEKFLTASTDERKTILQKLFDTSIYSKFQQKVKDEHKALNDKVQDHNKNKKIYIQGVMCDEGSTYFELLNQAKEGNLADDKLVDLIETIINEDESFIQERDDEKKVLDSKLEKLNQKIGKAEEDKKNRENLDKLTRELDEYKKIVFGLEQKKKETEAELKDKKIIDEIIVRLEESLSDYSDLDNLCKEKNKAIKERDEFIKSYEDSNKRLEKLNKELNDTNEKLKELEKAGENLARLEADKKDIENRIISFNDLNKKLDSLNSAIKDHKNKCQELKIATDNKNEADRFYNTINDKFNFAQAGILAELLNDNEPCPVCGSMEHPKPATKEEDAPSEKDVKEAREKYEECNKILTDKKSYASVANDRCNTLKKEFCDLYSKLTEETIDFDIEDWNISALTIINNKSSVAKNALDSVDENIDDEKKNIKLRDDLYNKKKPAIEENIKQISNDVKSLSDNISNIKGNLEAKEIQINSLKAKLKYDNKSDVEKVIAEKKNKANIIQESYDKANKDYNDCTKSISNLEGAIKALEETLTESSEDDLNVLHADRNNLKVTIKKIESEREKVTSRRDNNNEKLENIIIELKKVEDVYKKLVIIAPIANTMNGSLSGKEKVELETFVLQRFFNQIVRRANVRLSVMTNNNYELKVSPKHKQNEGKTGLELSVIDFFATDGLERDINSLSGGEKFKASLALALGLSDEISSMSGGIKLDSLFIDEGFGSLDHESLESAIKIIDGLTDGNVLVGIISHVEILKERINKQLVVTKNKKGSEVEIVI